MNQDAVAKAATTKKMNQLAGVRRPLPGQDPTREANLRAELTTSFKPVGVVEMLWLNDIAYCMASMDVIRAQISGLQMRLVEDAHAHMVANEGLDEFLNPHFRTEVPQDRYDRLTMLAEHKFKAPCNKSFLADSAFVSLLAGATKVRRPMLACTITFP